MINIDSCPLCDSELDIKDYDNHPEWKYVCPEGHYEEYIAFWGCIYTINDHEFKVSSGINNEHEVRDLADYLLHVTNREIIQLY